MNNIYLLFSKLTVILFLIYIKIEKNLPSSKYLRPMPLINFQIVYLNSSIRIIFNDSPIFFQD